MAHMTRAGLRAFSGAAVMVLALLSACVAPVSRDLQFGATSPNALIVLVTPRYDFPSIAAVREVDLVSQRFAPDADAFDIARSRPSQLINRDTQSGFWLSMREVQPGDYALVELASGSFDGAYTRATVLCLNSAAPVYRVSSGEIVIISTWNWWQTLDARHGSGPSEQAIALEFERVRAAYPSIAGAPTLPSSVASINWPRRNGMSAGSRHCVEPDEFSLADATP